MSSLHTPGTLKKVFLNLAKVAFVAALFAFLGKNGFFSLAATQEALSRWQETGVGLAITFGSALLGGVRWHWLLRSQGMSLALTRTLELNLIGQFFNIALPGAVSGDFVKAFYIGKEVQGRRAHAFGSILFDRLIGLSALVLVAAGAVALGYSQLQATPVIHGIRIFLSLGALVVVAFYTYLFTVADHRDPILLILKKLEQTHSKAGSLRRIYEGVRHYRTQRWIVFRALFLSVVIHILVTTAAWIFARALGERDLALIAVTVVVPIGMLATAIPIMPGGMGTGHAAFTALFILLGSQRGADVYNLFMVGQILPSLLGGLIYLRFKSQLGTAPDPLEPAPLS